MTRSSRTFSAIVVMDVPHSSEIILLGGSMMSCSRLGQRPYPRGERSNLLLGRVLENVTGGACQQQPEHRKLVVGMIRDIGAATAGCEGPARVEGTEGALEKLEVDGLGWREGGARDEPHGNDRHAERHRDDIAGLFDAQDIRQKRRVLFDVGDDL